MGIFNNLFDIDSRDNYAVTGLNKELNSLYIYNYFIKNKKNNLVITNSLYEANDVYNRLLNYTNKVLFFPMDDFITSEVTDISPEFVIDRLTTLNKLLGSGKYIVVTNLMGILRYLPNTKLYKNKIIDINKDMDIDRDDFINKLFDLGYEKKPVVSRTGEMAIRGYVIDIFPIEFDNPIRIEFWGDTIDSIKYFDLEDQISNTSVDSVLDKIPNNSRCVVKKGYFPDTANDVNDEFIFVNLDADLYKPTIEGLHFFWNKMKPGGVILIHDYFSDVYTGVNKAVNEFCIQEKIYATPIGDTLSVALIKNI